MQTLFWILAPLVALLGIYELLSRCHFTRHNTEQFAASDGVYWIILVGSGTTIAKMRTKYVVQSEAGEHTVYGYCITITHKYKQEDV